jgi:hypothetical protein
MTGHHYREAATTNNGSAGFSLPEIAEMLGISQSPAKAAWTDAKTWLKREIEKA